MATSLLSPREERMKVREGDRLYRSLRRIFPKPFGFSWTYDETSFFDGKDIWVKYDMQTPAHRPFTDSELRVLRHGHGVHEAGHSEFDYLPHYNEWLDENKATSRREFLDNEKYPYNRLTYFGNMALDGRLERLICLKAPLTQPYLDFNNYEWRFGIRGDHVGQDKISDFKMCYSHRVLGMTDMEEWIPESVELMDSVSDLVETIRLAPTTKDCLVAVSELIPLVWPTLIEWMELEEQEPEDEAKFVPIVVNGNWAGTAEEANSRSMIVIEQNTPDNSSVDSSDEESEQQSSEEAAQQKEDAMKSLVKQIARQLERDESDVDEELKDEGETNTSVTINGLAKAMNAPLTIGAIKHPNLSVYKASYATIKRYVKPVARELQALLEGVPDQSRRNVKSGHLMPSKVWKATHCEDNHVFHKNSKGTPKEDAFIGCMTDISGSTWSQLKNGNPIFEEMRRGLALLLEASHIAGIPTEAYAFTEYEQTEIYRLKTNAHEFTDVNRSSIGGISAESGNRDTVALQYLLDRVGGRQEGIRLAVMLSDGIPCFEENEGPSTITNMVKKAEKQGIEVLCLFIGSHDESTLQLVKEMYPGRVINADKGIPKELQKHVKRIIRQRR